MGVNHHEVFSHFAPFSGEVAAFRQHDFLGTTVRREFVAGLLCYPEPITVQGRFPAFDEEYFEWIDVLESVVAARGSYTMIELGAGYGRWSARAAYAVKQFNPELPFRLVAVEAEPTVFDWLRMHFIDNGIDPDQHRLIHGAISDTPGSEVSFCIGGPDGRGPGEWYGQALAKGCDVFSQTEPDGEYHGFKVSRHKSGWRSIHVPAISLSGLLSGLDRVDLIDMDMEGAELLAVNSAIEELDAKVKRLHIGTHSKEIEAGLRQVLLAHGWCCHADYPLSSVNETQWGAIYFQNGVQSWVNPRLL